jgi:hypothetical protein
MLTNSLLWQEIKAENHNLKELLNNSEVSQEDELTGRYINELFLNSNAFEDFAENFVSRNEASLWWDKLNK